MYHLETTKRFDKEFKKLDRYTQKMLKSWLMENIEGTDNPRKHGKDLVGNKKGFWRYRIGDYRIITEIQDERVVVLALSVGHRREVYR